MKKRLSFAIIVLTICIFALCAIGCSETIATPFNTNIDSDYNLTWAPVDGARSYEIEVKNTETDVTTKIVSRKTTYSLAKFDKGLYEIKIKAIAGKDDEKNSKWSKVIEFYRPYESGCIYTLINGGSEYELTRAGVSEGEINVGDENGMYRGKPVTTIAKNAFKGNNRITKITMGKYVKSIGTSAFYNATGLSAIDFADSQITTIGASAFQGCRGLLSIVLPETVTVIEDSTFAYCRALESVTIGSKVTSIGKTAFSACNSLKSLVIPDEVKTIAEHAFSENEALTSLTIGKGVESIDEYAFAYATNLETITFAEDGALKTISAYVFLEADKLVSVELPEGLETIGNFAFSSCDLLTTITLPSTLTSLGRGAFVATALYIAAQEASQAGTGSDIYYVGNWVIGCNTTKFEEVKEIYAEDFKEGVYGFADYAFYNLGRMENNIKVTGIEEVYLPETLKYLGAYSFAGNFKLWKVDIPDGSVKKIGAYAFASCNVLMNLYIGEGVEEIGDYAFMGCTKVDNPTTGLLIPSSVTRIGAYAFYQTALYSKPVNNIMYAGNWIVGASPMITESTLKQGTVGIADYAFNNCQGLRNITGDATATIKYVGVGAFRNCVALATITLGDNLREIKELTFYNCALLFRVSLPPALKTIGKGAFYGCSTLSEIDMSSTDVTVIEEYAFYNCLNLKSARFSNKTTEIQQRAFYGCLGLDDIRIPDSVTSIGTRAFYGCLGLKNLTIGSGIEVIGESAFSKCASITDLVIPGTVKELSRYAFYGCAALANLTIEEGVETIGELAFYGAASLKTLVIPASVKTIGKYAFRGCTNMENLVLRGEFESVGAHAFYGSKLMTIYSDNTAEHFADVDVWNIRWNSSTRPVITGCTFDADGKVVSVAISEDTIINATALNGIVAPQYPGYIFAGWSTSEGGSVEYYADEIVDVADGITLYAVWEAEVA